MSKYTVDISVLKNYEKNPRSIKKDDFERLKKHITDHGQMQPLVVTPDNEVLGGNMRLRAYRELGISGVWVEVVEPKDEADKLRIALVLNDRAGYYDGDLLANLIPEYPEFNWEDYAVDLKEPQLISEILDQFKEVEEDEAPAVAEGDAVSELGKVYQVGRHRVMCGDATNPDNVAKLLDGNKPHLMITDPPYGVEYDADWRNKAQRADGTKIGGGAIGKVSNDERADWSEAWVLSPSVVAYVYHGGKFAGIVQKSLEECGFVIRNQIIWAKNNFAISRGDYHWKHEPCWYAVKEGENAQFVGDRSQTTVWNIDKPMKSDTGHSTQKPVECMLTPIKNHEGDVYDPFGGSGTTLIAAEQANRTCYMMELSPAYADVIRKRYCKHIGKDNWEEETPEITVK